jgi:methylglutaconyl-CoA hydratase
MRPPERQRPASVHPQKFACRDHLSHRDTPKLRRRLPWPAVSESQELLARIETADGVATVTLDSPANRNALSRRLLAELEAALDAASADPSVRVIVLTGAGPAFCSGADLKEQREARTDGSSPLASLPVIFTKLWNYPQPVVCRLNGPVRAGGMGLAASCDFVVAPAKVTFSFTEVRIGVVPAVISVPVLRRIAPQAAHRLFLTGEVFGVELAREIGLVDEVAPEGELDETVTALVAKLMRGAPEALALTKGLAHSIGSLPPEQAFAQVTTLSEGRFASAEGQEGMLAFAEKRDAAWIPKRFRSQP